MLVSKQLFLKDVPERRPKNLDLEPLKDSLQDFVYKTLKEKIFQTAFYEKLSKSFCHV